MTVKITADMVKQLRQRTGVGMSKCKAALDEAGGDLDKAIAILRKAGAASAVKKSAREANEGLVCFKESDDKIAYVEVNAETDFVVKNEKFQAFVEEMTSAVLNSQPDSLESLMGEKAANGHTNEENRVELVQAIGENIQVRRFVVFDKAKDCSYGLYRHLGGKIACFAEVKGSSSVQELAKDIAMHVAADAPDFLKPEDIPADVIEKEKEIARGQVKNKPPEIVEKILVGKIKAFSDQVCLLGQKFIKDTSVTVAQHVQAVGKQNGVDLEVTKFLRWEVGQD
ncbi:MAG: Elongation factor Ts [Chlamydiia bacterium]|nr:Elongation factor Ts [Chlamydiia bacterium]